MNLRVSFYVTRDQVYEEGYEKLGGVQRYFADGVREEYAEGQLDAQVEGVLQEMRELSICGLPEK